MRLTDGISRCEVFDGESAIVQGFVPRCRFDCAFCAVRPWRASDISDNDGSPFASALPACRACRMAPACVAIPDYGLIRVDRGNLGEMRGCVIAANHPSLIDVVLVSVLVPRTLFVAKHALLKNPFMSAIVRNTSLPDDEGLPEAAAPYLADGWNVLVFPEGTRSPSPWEMREFHRGAAQLALRCGAKVACIGIKMTDAILGKHQRPWQMGKDTVVYSFRADAPVLVERDAKRGLRPQAAELTQSLFGRINSLRQ